MTDQPTKKGQPEFGHVGFDDFLNDLFGISIKGLKSLLETVVNPADFFEAARRPDWGGRYIPALRLWLTLMTIMIGLQFFWASENGAFINSLATLPDAVLQQGVADGRIDPAARDAYNMSAAAQRIASRHFVIYPFIMIACFLCMAAIFRPWKQGENFVVSQRYVFGTILPGTIFGVAFTLLIPFMSVEVLQSVSFAQIAVIGMIYVVTAYRGPMRSFGKDRLGMSVVMAVLMVVTVLIAQTISLLVAAMPIFVEIVSL